MNKTVAIYHYISHYALRIIEGKQEVRHIIVTYITRTEWTDFPDWPLGVQIVLQFGLNKINLAFSLIFTSECKFKLIVLVIQINHDKYGLELEMEITV